HGVPAQKSPPRVITKHRARAIHDLLFGAAHICDKGVGRSKRSYSLDQIDDRSHGRSQYYQVTSLDRLDRVLGPEIDCVHRPRTIKNNLAIAAHDPAGKTGGL